MNLKRIIAELKKRNVVKEALAYLVVAWMILQVASTILPVFDSPAYAMRIMVIILLIGFPLWVVFSWIYTITPKGIHKTAKNESTLPVKTKILIGERLNKIIIISLVIAVILLLYNQYRNQPYVERGMAFTENGLSGSLAVLPFTNNKPDPESDYLGFAIADQIIGDLNYLQNIIVRSSSSVRKYDKQLIDYEEVKEYLNVDYILIGNYLKEDDRMRLNVELVDMESNEMLWRSEPIEVDFSNTFELQDIVSKRVLTGLNIKFSEKEFDRIQKDISNNPLAYEYFLKSISYPLTSEGDSLALEMLKQSITLDSLYAPAHAEFGFRSQRIALFEMQDPEKFIHTEKYYLKALNLNPELLSAMGYLAVLYTESAKTEEAVRITKKMIEINPNNASARFSLGYLYRYIGMIHESVAEMEKALELDPKNPNYGRLGISYLNLNEFDKAFETFAIAKETSYVLIWQGITLYRKGDFKEALSYFDQAIERQVEPYIINSCIVFKASIEGDMETGLKAVKTLEDSNIFDSEGWYYYSVMYSILGDQAGGLRCLKRAVDGGYYNYPLLNTDPLLENLRGSPEFDIILEQAKERHIYFKGLFFDKNT